MKTIAICYWGLTRSTKKVYKSHYEKFLNIIKNNGYDYDIFMHTWSTEENFIWGEKCNMPIDYEEYKLLSPNYYQIDNQDDFLKSINFADYFDEKLYNMYGNSPHEWDPKLIRNHLCALESQKRVTNMVLDNEKIYDLVIYVRPDVLINNEFDVNYLTIDKNTISVPRDDGWEGYNDRFAIVNYIECDKYGKRIDEIIDFRKNNGRIVSEKYVKYIIDKYFEKIIFIDFSFTITRP